MDIRILKDKNNALLNRRELDFIVKYEGSTPSRNDVRNKLAAMLNAPLELLVVQRIKTEYGLQEGKGYAKLYENADRMKEVELEYVMKRNAIPGIYMAVKDYYKVQGDSVTRIKQFCPRCGPGTFLADHKNRLACGKCGYTEFKK